MDWVIVFTLLMSNFEETQYGYMFQGTYQQCQYVLKLQNENYSMPNYLDTKIREVTMECLPLHIVKQMKIKIIK